MALSRLSPCKVNLLLNILGKRPDGFHELETILYPVPLCDRIEIERGGVGVSLSGDLAGLPADNSNLVCRAAAAFLQAAGMTEGLKMRLEKRIPLEAGLGGGSGNAATTLLLLNDLFDRPLGSGALQALAAGLGSDVPFFLQSCPALGTGQGEIIQPLEPFPVLQGLGLAVIHPGFGVPTAWAYRQLAGFPAALQGQPGRARRLIDALSAGSLTTAVAGFYNAFEAPVFTKYPILLMYQEFLRGHGAIATLLSGSGSATFGLFRGLAEAQGVEAPFRKEFGDAVWWSAVAL